MSQLTIDGILCMHVISWHRMQLNVWLVLVSHQCGTVMHTLAALRAVAILISRMIHFNGSNSIMLAS